MGTFKKNPLPEISRNPRLESSALNLNIIATVHLILWIAVFINHENDSI
jgi:hypothetical protein